MKTLLAFVVGAIAATAWLTYEPKATVKVGGRKVLLVTRPSDDDPATRVVH